MRLTKGSTTFDYEGDRLLSESRNGTPIRYVYGASGVIGFKYNGANYYFVRNLQGDVTRIVDANNQIVAQYTYDAWGNCTVTLDTNGIGSLNAIRYRGYYFDSETNLYYLQTRYYDPEIGRFISPADVSSLNANAINGLNLYAYAISNPVCIAYSNPNSGGSTNGGMVSSIGGLNNSFLSKERLSLPAVPWLVENSTTIYGALSSLLTGFPIASHYFKYASVIKDEFRLYGISKWKTSLDLSNVSFKMGALDAALIGVNVLIDMYDSYQRGVSTEGIILGGALTAASGVGLFYLNKGIMWATTTVGTAICPGLGTGIGFAVGLFGSILVDIILGGWISDRIDENIK